MTVLAESSNTSTTPNGTVIEFIAEPRGYTVNGISAPSVTEVLSVLEKGGLVRWGEGVGVAGVLKLIETGNVGRVASSPVIVNKGEWAPATKENVTALLKEMELSTDHVRDSAGVRGSNVHGALEAWCVDGEFVSPYAYPEEERGYVEGLNSFLAALKVDKRSPVLSEVMVGSAEHRFAGRYDLNIPLLLCELKTTPKMKSATFRGRWMFDLKTSSKIYDTHYWQLEAYEGASLECGYPATVGRAVVRVTKDGLYEVKRSSKTYDEFLVIRQLYDIMKGKK